MSFRRFVALTLILLVSWGSTSVTSRAQSRHGDEPRSSKPRSSKPRSSKPRPSKPAPETNDERFHAKLLQIAQEYQKYRRVDSDAHWAALDCRVPSRYLGVPRVSKSSDKLTHGKKLYYLYAKKQQAYRDVAKSADQRGQVVVKETWEARSVEWGRNARKNKLPELTAKVGEQHFVPGKPGALFVMYRNQNDRLNDATDKGWVYGTVSVDRKTVSSAGRVKSCMRCHRSAPHGRLFGVKDLPSIFTEPLEPKHKPVGKSENGTRNVK